jgi:hypothetical protein
MLHRLIIDALEGLALLVIEVVVLLFLIALGYRWNL